MFKAFQSRTRKGAVPTLTASEAATSRNGNANPNDRVTASRNPIATQPDRLTRNSIAMPHVRATANSRNANANPNDRVTASRNPIAMPHVRATAAAHNINATTHSLINPETHKDFRRCHERERVGKPHNSANPTNRRTHKCQN